MDALAKLYAYNGEYEHTLHIYLRLQRGDAFGLIAQVLLLFLIFVKKKIIFFTFKRLF